MKVTFYKKQGKRYVAVSEYDDQLTDSFPKGTHVVICRPGLTNRRYNVDPDYAALIAAGIVAEDAISKKIVEATDLRPSKQAITPKQRDAWENLKEAFGDDIHALQWPSAREAAALAVDAMQKEANKLLTNPAVRKAYDHFILMCKLTKEGDSNETRS